MTCSRCDCRSREIEFDPARTPELTYVDVAAPTLIELELYYHAISKLDDLPQCEGDTITLTGSTLATHLGGQLVRDVSENWCPQLAMCSDVELKLCGIECGSADPTCLRSPFQAYWPIFLQFDSARLVATPLNSANCSPLTFAADLDVDSGRVHTEPIELPSGWWKLAAEEILNSKPRRRYQRRIRVT